MEYKENEKMKKSIVLPVFLALAIALAACAPAAAPAPTQAPAPTKAAATKVPATEAPKATVAPAMKDIVDTAVAAGRFKTLATALQAAGLVDVLKGKDPFTVFAPTDEAFAKLPKETLAALLKDPKALGEILKYHVVSGAVKAADVVKLSEAKTLQGEPITIKVDGGTVMINDAKVVKADIETSNGVIHVIDTVIMPPSRAMADKKDIVDTAVAAGNFKTLAAALQAPGLVDALKGKGPFTVFAPTDEAFAKLPAGTVDALLKDKAKLTKVLTYHVVAGLVPSTEVVKLKSATTVEGQQVAIMVM